MAGEQKQQEKRDEEVFSDTRERSETNDEPGPDSRGIDGHTLPETGTNGHIEQTTGPVEEPDGMNPTVQERGLVKRNGKEVGQPEALPGNTNVERPSRYT